MFPLFLPIPQELSSSMINCRLSCIYLHKEHTSFMARFGSSWIWTSRCERGDHLNRGKKQAPSQITKAKQLHSPYGPLYKCCSNLFFLQVAPFGGVKQSGLGREGSKYGMDEYLEVSIAIRHANCKHLSGFTLILFLITLLGLQLQLKYICMGNLNWSTWEYRAS